MHGQLAMHVIRLCVLVIRMVRVVVPMPTPSLKTNYIARFFFSLMSMCAQETIYVVYVCSPPVAEMSNFLGLCVWVHNIAHCALFNAHALKSLPTKDGEYNGTTDGAWCQRTPDGCVRCNQYGTH